MNKLNNSYIYKDFKKVLKKHYGAKQATCIWADAGRHLHKLTKDNPRMDNDSKMMILPVAALYRAHPELLPLLRDYGTSFGKKLGKTIYDFTSIPGVPKLLWKKIPKAMRRMSSPEKGYERRIISETEELIAVDILTCPLHQAAIRLGMPEITTVICAMDSAYMSGYKNIDFTRTTALGEGGTCCDYRLRYNPNKKQTK